MQGDMLMSSGASGLFDGSQNACLLNHHAEMCSLFQSLQTATNAVTLLHASGER
jgi:hypothetical protein